MTPQTHTLVTANFARGVPAAWAWLERILEDRRPSVIFGQELAGQERLTELASQYGYQMVWPQVQLNPRWQVVS